LKLCEYGCGKEAKHQLKNGKMCCSKGVGGCISKSKMFIREIKNKEDILCSYGCNQRANYRFKNGNYCCREHYNSCLANKEKNRKMKIGENNPMFNKPITDKHREKLRKRKHMGDTHSKKTRRKMRISCLKNIESRFGQVFPNYNQNACRLIEKYGEQNGYNFKHAENGGEYFIKELGYWVDGYDKEKNVVIEIDESHHFDYNGNLKEKDIKRQEEIENFLKCKFIRLKNL
jgi:hypothetical protein